MEEQTLKPTGRQAPYSHQSRKTPIVGTFATPGILCTNLYLSPHGSGVGDHRFQLHDFDADSVLGSEYPKTVRPTGRALRCEVTRTRKKCIKKLKKGFVKHRIYQKLENLHLNKSSIPRGEFQLKFNSWDREVTQLKMGSKRAAINSSMVQSNSAHWWESWSEIFGSIGGSSTLKLVNHATKRTYGELASDSRYHCLSP